MADDHRPVILGSLGLGVTADDIDPDQAYFWTPEWQAGEREAEAAYANRFFETLTKEALDG